MPFLRSLLAYTRTTNSPSQDRPPTNDGPVTRIPKPMRVIAHAGLRAKFVREARAKWPDLPEHEIQRRADHAFQGAHAEPRPQVEQGPVARKAAESSGGDDHAA